MAELHRNQYPYAEDFVFVVTGGEIKDGSFDLAKLKSFFIVGRHEDTVKKTWHQLCHSKEGWVPLACLSMKDLGRHRQSLLDAAASPDGYTKIPCADMASSSSMNRVPWLITLAHEKQAAPSSTIVMAKTAEDIADWAAKKRLALASVLNQAMIEETWQEMVKVQNGKARVNYFAEEEQDVVESYAAVSGPNNQKRKALMSWASNYLAEGRK
jgi:hypothetical protein